MSHIDVLVKKKLKRKKKKKYEPMGCVYCYPKGHKRYKKPCKRMAVGKGTLCKKHGGVITKDLLIPDDSADLKGLCKYRPEFHPFEFLRLAKDGKSITEIAAEFMIAEKTLKNWSETYENFQMAFEIGMAMHESYYIAVAKRNMSNPLFQTALFKFIAANKLGYADKIESKNLNANVHGVLMVPGKMSIDEWENADFTEETEAP